MKPASFPRLKRGLALALLPAACLALTVHSAMAQGDEASSLRPTTVDLSAEASRRAPNDFASAGAYFEASGKDPAEVAKQVNEVIRTALQTLKGFPSVSASSSGQATYPVYSKDSRRIEGWRTRAQIALESHDLPALSNALGKLQETMMLSELNIQPSPATRNKVADETVTDAIRAFEARAKIIADSMGKQFRIRNLNVNYGGGQRPYMPMMRAAVAADSAPVAIEAGDSEITVHINGTIELTN